jgi:penicillin-binding protein 1C
MRLKARLEALFRRGGPSGPPAEAQPEGSALRKARPPIRKQLLGGGLLLLTGLLWLRCGPLPPGLLDAETQPSTVVVDRHGERLYEARSTSGVRTEAVDAAAVPPVLAHATLAAEDVRFRWHPGVDPIAMARAAIRDLRARTIVEGGSTITQQVAKLLLARRHGGVAAHGWRAKVREAVVALRLEHRLSKDAILALYLNLAPYGNQVQGAGRASRAYFGRDARTLTPAEAAFLAALPQKPSRFNPWRSPDGARARQQRILAVMRTRGWLAPQDYATATAEHLTLTRERAAWLAPHFVARALEEARPLHPSIVETTLDAGLQRTVEGIIDAQRDDLVQHQAANVAVAVLDNHTGEWLAWEGSGDYFDAAHGGTIDGVVAPRQPGSALKPFTYAAAFERGVTPALALPDVPSQFETAKAGILYSPRNYDGRFRGPLLARAALAGSENVPAVALASKIGVSTIARLLRRAGLSTLDRNADHYGVGLTLGNAEVRLDELVAAYAMLARGGETIAPRLIRRVNGRPVDAPGAVERVISDRTAFWITDVLSDADARSYVFGRGGSLEFPFPVAAKTGTSQSYFDNWTIGYTRDVTVGVWVGNFDRRPLRGSSGVTGAGPIFHAVMLAAVERARGSLPIGDVQPIVAPPADLHRVEICAMSGMRATDACPTRATEWLSGDATGPSCTWHHASDEGLVTVFPEVYREWARDQGLLARVPVAAAVDARPASAARVTLVSTGHDEALTITRPLGGALFLLDPTLRPEFQTLALSARGGAPGPLDWFVDDEPVGRDPRDGRLHWPLARGRHVIVVRDAAGRSARTYVDVR